MYKINRTNLALCFSIIIPLSSYWTTSKFLDRATYNTATVPAGYNSSKHILLFVEMPRLNAPDQTNTSVTKKLDEALKEYFPYKYEIASKEDILNVNSKYSDTSVYRFAVSNNLNIVTRTTTTTYTEKTSTGTNRYSTSPSARTAYLSFSFYDRINGQQHPNTGNSSAKLAYAVAAFSELVKRAKK